MSLIDFSNNSQTKLRGVLGSFDTKIQERVARSQVGYIENQYFKITDKVDIEAEGDTDASTEFKAIEVQPNGEEVSNGIVFDSDATESTNVADPIYLPNLKFNTELFSGSVEVGKAYTVEEVDSDTFGEASDWYVIPKGGAGGGGLYAKIKENIGDSVYIADIYTEPSNDVDNSPIEEDVACEAYNVNYGEISIDLFLPFTYATGSSSNTSTGFITVPIWI